MKVQKLVTLDVGEGTLGITPETLDQIVHAALVHGIKEDHMDEVITVESVTEVGTSNE